MSPQIYVKFNDFHGWYSELLVNPPNIEPIVRMSRMASSSPSGTYRHLDVVANYLVKSGEIVQIVELHVYCGEIWNNAIPDEKTYQMAKAFEDNIREGINKVNEKLHIRGLASLRLSEGLYSA